MFNKKDIMVKILIAVVFVILNIECLEGNEIIIEVVLDKANIRIEPSIESEIIYQVQLGTILLSFGKSKDWYRVHLPHRKDQMPIVGFIHQSAIREIGQKKRDDINAQAEKSKNALDGGGKRYNWIKLETKYFIPSEPSVKDLYGESLVIGGEITMKIYRLLGLWINGNFYSKDGYLPLTKEKTSMTLIPIGVGLKARLKWKSMYPYVGAGPVFYSYKEVNPLGKAQGTGIGIMGKAGVYTTLIKRFFFDVSFDYIYCEVKPQRIKADLGGIKVGIGLGFEF